MSARPSNATPAAARLLSSPLSCRVPALVEPHDEHSRRHLHRTRRCLAGYAGQSGSAAPPGRRHGSPTRAWTSTPRRTAPNGACSGSISGWSRSIRRPTALSFSTGCATTSISTRRRKPSPSTIRSAIGCGNRPPGLIMQTIAIPRGQVVLAGGTAKPDDKRISVEARRGDTRFGICSTTFLEEAFRTDYYRIDITFNDDGSWTYVTRTDLAVRGKTPAVRPPRHQHLAADRRAGAEPARSTRQRRRGDLSRLDRLFQVFAKIVGVFQAHRQAQQARGHAQLGARLRRQPWNGWWSRDG